MSGDLPAGDPASSIVPQADAALPEPPVNPEESETAGSLPTGMANLDASAEGPQEPELAADDACQTRTIDLRGAAPDMLIVLDRSLSMSLNRRWAPSKEAVKAITRDFGGLLRFGMSVFPGSGGECSQGRLDVPLAIDNSAAISELVDQTEASGLTPTGPALSQALRILRDRAHGADGDVPPAYVLLVTDGEPNCHALPLFPDITQQDAARAAVRALRENNVPTYVIGYQIEAAYQGMMNDLAVLGGTSRYRPVESGEQIVATFREIAKDVVECNFELTETPDARRVRVEIDQQTIALGASDGWTLDGQTITLQGAACAKLQDGRGHLLSAQLECGEVLD
jgi:Mg-chelatase subunit ChlD